MKRIAISGGPHTGKTTLFEALKRSYPSAAYIEEPATFVLTNADSAEERSRIVSTRGLFCELCLNYSEEQESRIGDVGLVLYDRTTIDTIAYAKRDDCIWLLPRAKSLARAARYSAVLFCEPVGEYTANANRTETADEAYKTHEMLHDAYTQMDIPIITLPALPVTERAQMAARAIEALPTV